MSEHPNRAAVAERAARAGAIVAAEDFRRGVDVETKGGKTNVVTEADRAAQRRVVETIRETYPGDVVVAEEEAEEDGGRDGDGATAGGDVSKEIPAEGPAWVVDPIDGTNNYVRDIRVFGTAVAAVVDGEPVAAATVLPAMDDAYTADGETSYRNGDPVSVSHVSDPERATVAPTVWWGFDRRDEYAAACAEVVHRFGDMRRFGSAQVTLAMVAEGALEGTLTNVRCHPWDTVAGVHMVRQAGGRVTDLHGDHWTHDARGLVASNGGVHDELLAAARGIDDAVE